MWIDIRKHFIPYKLSVDHGKAVVKGLYLKEDEFNIEDIQYLTTFEVYTHWWRRVHTLFLPHVEHFKLTLKDGRSYHFHGHSTKVKEMLVDLTGITNIQPGEE